MITVIPMAGDGLRFLEAGYDVIKPMLPMPNQQTLIETIIRSIKPEKLIVIAQHSQRSVLEPHILALAEELRFHFKLNWLKHKTSGPLDTLLNFRKDLNVDEELLINYCDCYIEDGVEEFLDLMHKNKAHGGAVCFNSTNPRFQREPSMRFAMSGISWFASGKKFIDNAKNYLIRPDVGPNLVAFGMFEFGIPKSSAFITDNIIDVGVPGDYEAFMNSRNNATVEMLPADSDRTE